MKRSTKAIDLTTKAARARLTPRRDPYFMKLGPGFHLGYRPVFGTWVGRYRDRSKKTHFHAIKNLPGRQDEYVEAKAVAERWHAQMTGVPVLAVIKGSVRAGVKLYVDKLRDDGRGETADRMEKLFERVLDGDEFADVLMTDMTIEDFKGWRSRIKTAKPRRGKRAEYDPRIRDEALRRRAAGESKRAVCRALGMDPTTLSKWQREAKNPPKPRGRQNASVNRIVRQMRAALNAAVAQGMAANPLAWKLTRLHEAKGLKRPALSPEQRDAVIAHSDPELINFLMGLEQAHGPRPIELARAKVADLDIRNGTLRLWSRKGKDADVRERFVVLSTEGLAFFKRMARNKLPNAPLITSPTGGVWKHHQWANGIRKAARAINANLTPHDPRYIPPKACAYSIRHARISELLQVSKLDLCNVSDMVGTSVEVIKANYYHPDLERTRAALDRTSVRKAS